MTFTQRQAWCIVRKSIARWKKPVRLTDNTCLDPLQHLSQLEALKEVTSLGKYVIHKAKLLIFATCSGAGRVVEPLSRDSPAVSPYFGIFAFINIGVFIVAGVAIPWLISEGWRDAPIVRSKLLEDCVTSNLSHHFDTIVDEYPNVEAILQPCNGRSGRGCEDQFYLRVPKIEKVRTRTCPFNDKICHKGVPSLTMTHSNLTTFEAGINTKSKISISRRVTCAPVVSEPFLLPYKYPERAAISIRDHKEGEKLENLTYLPLQTMNGPNKYSNYSSGLLMARSNGLNDLVVLPIPFWAESVRNDPSLVHPSARRVDGMPFLIVWRGGTLNFIRGVVDDPFFSAHQRYRNSFVSDYEANTLGCVEQLRCCMSDPSECLSWGSSWQQLALLKEKLRLKNQSVKMLNRGLSVEDTDHVRIAELLWSSFSMYDYIGYRWIFNRLVPPLQRSIGASGKIDDRNEQWAIEVEKWFMKALIGGLLSIRDGMRWNTDRTVSRLPIEEKRRYTLCGRVLFRDSGHTNINCLGLVVTLVALSLICFSKTLERISARIYSSSKKLNIPNSSEAFNKFMNTFMSFDGGSTIQGSWKQKTRNFTNRIDAASRLIKFSLTLVKRNTPVNEPVMINITDLNSSDTSNDVAGQAWWEVIDGII